LLPLYISAMQARQPANPDAIEAIAWSPDGSRIASGHTDGTVRIWDTQNPANPLVFQDHTDAVISLAWSPDGEILLSGGLDKTISVRSFPSGTLITILSEISGPVSSVVWTPDGSKILAFAGGFSSPIGLPIWEANSYTLLERKQRSGLGASAVAWNGDMSMLAAASATGGIQLYDPTSYEKTVFFANVDQNSFVGALYTLDWHPNNQWIATGNLSGWVRIWDTTTQQLVFEAKGTDNPILEWNTSAVRLVFFDSTGTYLTSFSTDGVIRMWDITTEQLLVDDMLPTSSPLYAFALSPDGTQIAYGGEEGKLWMTSAPNR
ncbi:MAG: WD40 repeat domain-containing protein, partial [Anaerolineae bacterium]|nr:WD40 repeat domain-containing protein [Anaerolineae bacterium]